MAEISLAALSSAKNQKDGLETAIVDTVQETTMVFDKEERQRIDEIKKSIDFLDTQSTIQYGIGAQRQLTEYTDSILSTVKSKDGGEVGDLLSELAIEIKSLDPSVAMQEKVIGKIPILKNAVHGIKKFKERYTKAEVQIDRIEAALEKARMDMLKDINMFDIMYQENLKCFKELEMYIQAGKERIQEIREETIPSLQAEAAASQNPMDAQLVNDFQNTVDQFEKKIYDLELSRTISIQSAPQIKLIQNNDRVLVDKIQTAILNTIPIWKSQFVIALGLSNQQRVLKMQQEINETTNAMLTKNAELLKTSTIETAKRSNEGIVDVETLARVNNNLISTIEETIQIQQQGRQKRQAAEEELVRIETQLKNKLIEIHS
ncbi:MAG: toxic anion resistance protein [Lachnospiraceae bacterium]